MYETRSYQSWQWTWTRKAPEGDNLLLGKHKNLKIHAKQNLKNKMKQNEQQITKSIMFHKWDLLLDNEMWFDSQIPWCKR